MLPCSTSLCPASASAAEPDGGRAVHVQDERAPAGRAAVPSPASRKLSYSARLLAVHVAGPVQALPGGRFRVLSDS
jgi:hypothetical protein